MRNKLTKGGVHINWAGKRAYVEFLMKTFTKCQPQRQSNNSSRPPMRGHGVHVSEPIPRDQGNRREDFRVRPPSSFSQEQFPDLQPASRPTSRISQEQVPPQQSTFVPTILGTDQQRYMPPQNQPSYGINEIAEALSHIMTMRRRGPQQNYRIQGQWG